MRRLSQSGKHSIIKTRSRTSATRRLIQTVQHSIIIIMAPQLLPTRGCPPGERANSPLHLNAAPDHLPQHDCSEAYETLHQTAPGTCLTTQRTSSACHRGSKASMTSWPRGCVPSPVVLLVKGLLLHRTVLPTIHCSEAGGTLC